MQAHSRLMIRADAPWPRACPGCRQGPFADLVALGEHVARMSDPQNREPSACDWLFGIRIEVREDAGEPQCVRNDGLVT